QHYWAGHPLALPVCGTRASVEAFDQRTCLEFLAARYRPDRLIVAVAGQIDHDRLVDAIAAHFGALTGVATAAAVAPPTVHPGVVVHQRRLEQVQLCLGTPGLAATDPVRDAAAVLNAALGDSPSSRLFQEVRERRGRAYSIDSFLAAYRDAGYVGIAA